MVKAFFALLLMSAPAMAGQTWCEPNGGLPYHIVEVREGFAVVRINDVDLCREAADGAAYVCENRDDYRLNFEVSGERLTLTYADGNKATFVRCD